MSDSGLRTKLPAPAEDDDVAWLHARRKKLLDARSVSPEAAARAAETLAAVERQLRRLGAVVVVWFAACGAASAAVPADVQKAVCSAFGNECAKALRVAGCETGYTYNVRAIGNRYGADPYYGLFQQGAYSRRTYGFGWDAWSQARAAKRMRDREGWRPWPVCGRR